MKLIFAVLDVSLTMGLTRCYKTEGFIEGKGPDTKQEMQNWSKRCVG